VSAFTDQFWFGRVDGAILSESQRKAQTLYACKINTTQQSAKISPFSLVNITGSGAKK